MYETKNHSQPWLLEYSPKFARYPAKITAPQFTGYDFSPITSARVLVGGSSYLSYHTIPALLRGKKHALQTGVTQMARDIFAMITCNQKWLSVRRSCLGEGGGRLKIMDPALSPSGYCEERAQS